MTGSDGPDYGESWSVRRIVTTMFPLLLVLSALEMTSGYVLESLERVYVGNPTLLVLVPVTIGTAGNLGSILSARLSTRLHLGLLSFDPRNEALQTNVVAVFALAMTVFTLLGGAAYVVGHLIGHPMALTTLLTITVTSGAILAGVVVVLSVTATYASYRLGLDPDDTTIPVVTNLADIIGVFVLSGVSLAVL
jgi:mgtE-like transporter